MSPSLLNAGRTTHLKIVAVALVAGIVVIAVGINARTSNFTTARDRDQIASWSRRASPRPTPVRRLSKVR